MSVPGRTIAITGAGRGLGAALAMEMAALGANPILLGRDLTRLSETRDRIAKHGFEIAGMMACDLTSISECQAAAEAILRDYPACDGIIHNGALWQGDDLAAQNDQSISDIVNSAVTGCMVLTRHLLGHFQRKDNADILVVGSATGLPHVLLQGSSVAYKAAKAAQDGFVQGLAEELRHTSIRVMAIHPGFFRDVMPDEPAWSKQRVFDDAMTDHDVVEAIIFMLSMPKNVAVRSMVIERNTDHQLWPNEVDDD